MKIAEVAKLLNMSNYGVMYHIYKGHIRAAEVPHKCPGSRRYDVSAAEITAYKESKLKGETK